MYIHCSKPTPDTECDQEPARRSHRRLRRTISALALSIIAAVLPSVVSIPVAEAQTIDEFGILPAPTADVATTVELTVADDADIDPELAFELRSFLASTALPSDPVLAPLVNGDASRYLSNRSVKYREVIDVDEVVTVNRRFRFELEPGVCFDPAARTVLASHCVEIDPSVPISTEVAQELADARAALAAGNPERRVASGMTAADALALADIELLDVLLNAGQRTVRHVSTMPLRPDAPGAMHEIAGTGTENAPDESASGPSSPTSFESQEATDSSGSTASDLLNRGQRYGNSSPRFDPEYLLTGFTHTWQVDKYWEYVIAEKSFWHGKYYVRVNIFANASVGMRVPIRLDVMHRSGDAGASIVDIAVDTVDVDENGSPAYPAVHLPEEDYQGGKEFVFEFTIDCSLELSIPGPDPSSVSCGEVDAINASRKLHPPLGDETTRIGDIWLGGDGAVFSVGISDMATLGLDFGMRTELTNGEISYRVSPYSNTAISGLDEFGRMTHSSHASQGIGMTSTAPGNPGFLIDDPRYSFDLEAVPLIAVEAHVDLYIYSNTWTRAFALESLAFSRRLALGHHDNTVANQPFVFRFAEEAAP